MQSYLLLALVTLSNFAHGTKWYMWVGKNAGSCPDYWFPATTSNKNKDDTLKQCVKLDDANFDIALQQTVLINGDDAVGKYLIHDEQTTVTNVPRKTGVIEMFRNSDGIKFAMMIQQVHDKYRVAIWTDVEGATFRVSGNDITINGVKVNGPKVLAEWILTVTLGFPRDRDVVGELINEYNTPKHAHPEWCKIRPLEIAKDMAKIEKVDDGEQGAGCACRWQCREDFVPGWTLELMRELIKEHVKGRKFTDEKEGQKKWVDGANEILSKAVREDLNAAVKYEGRAAFLSAGNGMNLLKKCIKSKKFFDVCELVRNAMGGALPFEEQDEELNADLEKLLKHSYQVTNVNTVKAMTEVERLLAEYAPAE